MPNARYRHWHHAQAVGVAYAVGSQSQRSDVDTETRYDAARMIGAFSVPLPGDAELDSARADVIVVINDQVHPAHASVWLRRPR